MTPINCEHRQFIAELSRADDQAEILCYEGYRLGIGLVETNRPVWMLRISASASSVPFHREQVWTREGLAPYIFLVPAGEAGRNLDMRRTCRLTRFPMEC